MDTAVAYPAPMEVDKLITTFITKPAQALFVANVVLEDHGQGMVYRGRSAVVPVLRAFFGEGFSDGRMDIQTTFDSEQTAAIVFTFNGRHDGVFFGIPATGRQVTVPMILLFRTNQDHIQHISWYYDAGTLLRQLGLAVAPDYRLLVPADKKELACENHKP